MSCNYKKFKFLALAGALVSLYLLYHHVEVRGDFQVGPSFCSIGQYFDCDKVASSKYSEIMGVPVAALSLLYFIVLFFIACAAGRDEELADDTKARVIALFSLLSLPPSLAMLFISASIIKSFCLFCSFLYLISFLLTGLSVSLLKKQNSSASLPKAISETIDFCTNFKRRTAKVFMLALIAGASLSYALPALVTNHYFVPRKKAEKDAVIVKLRESMQGIGVSKDTLPLDTFVLSDDFSSSDISAPVQIIEFMDYQCPACQIASIKLKEIVEKYGDKVNLVIKNYPLDNACNRNISRTFHDSACRAAAIARCAGASGVESFWDMHEAIFGLSVINEVNLKELPKNLGLNTEAILSCADNPGTIARIQQDIELGEKLRLKSTPSIYLYTKGKLVRGISVSMLETALEVLLD